MAIPVYSQISRVGEMAIPVMSAKFPVSSFSSESRSEIYVGALPLRAAKGPPQMLMSATYSLNLWDLQHYMVLIKPTSSPQSQVFVFDFQPQEPENIYVALAVLSGRGVPGVLLARKVTKLPKNKCWFVGFSNSDAIDRAKGFNEHWKTELKVGEHDCRDYTNRLVEYLTGETCVLDNLRRGQSH